MLVDGKGLPLAFGDILAGNHNDFFKVVPQFSKICKELKANEISFKEATLIWTKALIVKDLEERFKEEK